MYFENEFSIETDDIELLLTNIDKKHLFKQILSRDEFLGLTKEASVQCRLSGPMVIYKRMFGGYPTASISPMEQISTKLFFISKNADLEVVMTKIALLFPDKLGSPLKAHFILNDLQEFVYKKRMVDPLAEKRTIDLCLLDFDLIRNYSLPIASYKLPCIERLIAIYKKEKKNMQAIDFIDKVLLVIGERGITGSKIFQQKSKLLKSLSRKTQ